MAIKEGDKIPAATLHTMRDGKPAAVTTSELFDGKKVVVFAVPGAFTPTCDAAHMPSFVRTAKAFRQKGIDEIICISVNDPYVMQIWGQQSGAADAGITMLADAGAEFTQAVGMAYSKPAGGMINRSHRYAMLVENGVVTRLHLEASNGACEISGGEALLAEV